MTNQTDEWGDEPDAPTPDENCLAAPDYDNVESDSK